MNEEKRYLLMIGLYGRFQIEMIDLDMINSDGSVKSKMRKYYEQDGETRWRPLGLHEVRAIEIYKWIREQMKNISEEELNKKAEYTNEVAHKIINEAREVNNFLLALLMFQMYVDQDGAKDLQFKMNPKIDELVAYFQSFDTEEHKAIRKATYRCADNMFRVFTDRPQLSDEVRDAKFKRLFRRD